MRLTLLALLALTCLAPGCRDDEDSVPAVVDPGPDPDPGPGPEPGPGPGPDLGPDQGPGWWKQESGMNYGHITHVSFSDALHGWAAGLYDLSGNNNTFMRTVNGGHTWTPLPMPPGNLPVKQMEFQDELRGWVDQTNVNYKTTDGGVTWQVDSNSHGIKFVDSQTGWMLSRPGPATYDILKTTDGGATWSTMHLIWDDIRVNDLEAVGDSVWVVGEARGESPWVPVVGSYVVATSDGGATWSEQQVDTSKGLAAVDFADEMNGWTVGDRVYHTSNGGATWAAQSPALGIYRDVCFVNATTGWVVGADGVILRTRSGGEGPAPGPSPGPHVWSLQDADTNVAVTRVTAVDSDHAWIKRADGPILRTQDGGATWTSLGNPMNTSQIQFFDGSHGWLRGSGQLYSTSDGGETWTVRKTAVSAPAGLPPIWEFSFISATTGWVVLSSGYQLEKTTDGGGTWTELPELPANFMTLKFFDEQTGWLTTRTGSGPRIYKTSNGGLTWGLQFTFPGGWSTGLGDISAVSSTHAWVVGSGPGGVEIILATTNGGTTWTEQHSDGSSGLSGVQFVDADTGWAIGKKIHHTTDGGATWTVQSTPEEGQNFGWDRYYGLAFVNSTTGWVVGRDGIILKTTPGGE